MILQQLPAKKIVPYCSYGIGKDLLFAFHGYGMDGNQFRVLHNSICQKYQVIGFHLPYHKGGPGDHIGWLKQVELQMTEVIEQADVDKFSIAGYSLGAKIALYLVSKFKKRVKEVYLLAPYGLERHWGLDFVSGKYGNHFFKAIIQSKLPQRIISMSKSLKIIDAENHSIIQKELDTEKKRINLCNSLFMVGQISIDLSELIQQLNQDHVKTLVIYGEHDSLFPFHRRNKELLGKMQNCQAVCTKQGHWLMTDRLDAKLAQL